MYYDIDIYYDNFANSNLYDQLGALAGLTSVNLILANDYTTCALMTCISIVLLVLLHQQVIDTNYPLSYSLAPSFSEAGPLTINTRSY